MQPFHTRYIIAGLTLLGLLSNAPHADAQIPRIISYQGLLAPELGVEDGPHQIRISIYASQDGGAAVYSQTRTEAITGGLFSSEIGPLPETITFDRPYWVGIAIDESQDFESLTRMTTSPYAFNADHSTTATRAESAGRSDTAALAAGLTENATGAVRSVNGLRGDIELRGAGGADVIIDGNVITIRSDTGQGGGQTTDAWRLRGNSGTNPGTDYVGTVDNRAFEIHVDHNGGSQKPTEARGRVMRFEPTGGSPNIIAGFRENIVAPGFGGGTISGGGSFGEANMIEENFGTIGGGQANRISGAWGTVGGGRSNDVSGEHGTIGGGQQNVAGSLNSTIGGGAQNRASDWATTIGGGRQNSANSRAATISGGEQNQATGIGATIGGGVSLRVFGNYGTIGGGEGNSTSNEHPTVGGGRFNNASAAGATVAGGISDTAAGSYATVGGGLVNKASNLYATVAGGQANDARGVSSSVVGGTLNDARGDYTAIPGGYGMRIDGDRSFGFLASDPADGATMTLVHDNVALFANADLYVGGNDGTARRLVLYEPHTGNGNFPELNTHYSAFRSGVQNQTIDYILPTEPGSVGDVLTIASISGRTFTLAWTTPNGSVNGVSEAPTGEPTTAELIRTLQRKTEELERVQELLRTALERVAD